MIVSSSGQRKTRWTRAGRNGVSRCEDEDDENVIEVRENGIGLKVGETLT
jgi:hypothetical protein